MAASILSLASFATAQLVTTEELPKPAAAEVISEPESTERTGEPQAVATESATPAPPEQSSAPETSPAKPGTDAVATAPSSEEAAASTAPAPQVEKVIAPAPDMSAFIAALAAAERANENLAARLAQMEASAALQRERDQAFIRDMVKGVLLLAGTMASIGMLALVAIVYLQVRSTKQQAITFAAQLQALTSHVALPGPSTAAPAAALHAAQNRFDSTAKKIEQRLSDLESMTSGLPDSEAHDHSVEAQARDGQHAAIEYNVTQGGSSGSSNGERASDLLSKADSLLMQQQPEVALAYIDQAIGKSPRDPEAHLKRGNALERLNRLNDAITAYDRAIDAEPTLSVAFLAKAGVLNKLQRYAEALKCYEAALAQQGGQTASESPAA